MAELRAAGLSAEDAGLTAVVVKGWPRLSETFVAQEVLGLEERGLRLLIVSLRHPTDPDRHDLHERIRAAVTYLPEYLHDEPRRVWRGWRIARRLPGYAAAARAFARDLARDPSRHRIRRFGQACVLAAELPPEVRRLYAHFLHTPASVARYAALMTGHPLLLSAHAKDIWTTPVWDKREKLAFARWTTTCTARGAAHLRALAPDAAVLHVPHGIDLARFTAFPRGPGADGSDPDRPVRLLAVARAVPKKGLDVLLEALALLPSELAWRLEHIGGGPEVTRLRALAARHGLAERITWRGPLAFPEVLQAYRRADLFVLPLRVSRDGDRDGLPNVVVEALSQSLAVIVGDAGSADEVVEDGVTGRLVRSGDAAMLSAAILALARDPDARWAMGRAGRARVERSLAADAGLDRLAAAILAPSPEPVGV